MIKLNTIYSTKNGGYIVVIRNPRTKWYELHWWYWRSHLEDFKYLARESLPLFLFHNLSAIRYYARKVIDGEEV